MICSRGNQPMQRLAEKFGAHFNIDHGEALGEIEPDQANPLSFHDEMMHDTGGFMTAVLDWTVTARSPPPVPRHSRPHRG